MDWQNRDSNDEIETREQRRRGPFTWVELILAATLICLAGLLALPKVKASAEARHRSSCQANLKQLGLAFKMFANESAGNMWPALGPVLGNWVPDMDRFYPEYCNDLNLFICPSHPDSAEHRFELRDTAEHPLREPGEQHPDCVSSRYYVYTGFSTRDDYDAITIHDALMSGDWKIDRDVDLQSPLPYALDMLNGPSGSGVVMWDRMSLAPSQIAHRPLGANVLFMDGHVEFRQYEPNDSNPTFPVTSVSAELFGSLPAGLSPDCVP